MYIYVYIYILSKETALGAGPGTAGTKRVRSALRQPQLHGVVLALASGNRPLRAPDWRRTSWVPKLWVAVKEFKLSYHNLKTILLTIYP